MRTGSIVKIILLCVVLPIGSIFVIVLSLVLKALCSSRANEDDNGSATGEDEQSLEVVAISDDQIMPVFVPAQPVGVVQHDECVHEK